MLYTAGQRRQAVRDQTNPDGEHQACNNIYKPKVWRQPGCKAAAEIPVAPEPQTGVRPEQGRPRNGPGTVQEGAEPKGVGVRRRRHRRLGAVHLGPDSQRRVVSGGRASAGHRQRPGQGSRLGWRKYILITILYRALHRNQTKPE